MGTEQFTEYLGDDKEQPTVSNPLEHVVMCTGLVDLLKAVAHIGIDFGYGKYELEQKHIDEARRLYEIHNKD